MFSHALIWNWACVEASPADISMRGPSLVPDSVSWADPCTGSPRCVRAPPSALLPYPWTLPNIHKLPAQVTAFASPSSSSVTRPLASSSLLLQHSVDCLTHRKWQVNISCTERLCTWLLCCSCCCVPEMEPWVTASHSASSLPDPHQWIWASPLWSPLTKNILQCVGSGEHFSPNKCTLSLF